MAKRIFREDVKATIENAALNEFVENGFANTTIRGIAARAGMTSGNLYCYYENKLDLFNHVVEDALISFHEVFYWANNLLAKSEHPGEETLSELSERMYEYIKKYHREVSVILTGSEETRFVTLKDRMAQAVGEAFVELIHGGTKEKGSFTTIERKSMRLWAASFIESFVVLIKRFEENEWSQKAVDMLLHIYYRRIHRLRIEAN